MTEILLNGANVAPRPLAGWVISLKEGKCFIGRPQPGFSGVLRPVYGLACSFQMVHEGRVAIARQCWPILTFTSIQELDLTGALMIAIDDLSLSEAKDLARAVEQCESLCASIRAAEAGIVFAGPGTKLRDITGGKKT